MSSRKIAALTMIWGLLLVVYTAGDAQGSSGPNALAIPVLELDDSGNLTDDGNRTGTIEGQGTEFTVQFFIKNIVEPISGIDMHFDVDTMLVNIKPGGVQASDFPLLLPTPSSIWLTLGTFTHVMPTGDGFIANIVFTTQVDVTNVPITIGLQKVIIVVNSSIADTLDVTNAQIHLNAGWTTDLSVANDTQDSKILTLGMHPDATDGIDPGLQEVELPPLPPADIFDVRFQISGLNGLGTDLRAVSQDTIKWTVQIQAGSGGYPITLSWNPSAFPPDRTFSLQDAVTGGTLVDVDMKAQGSVQISNDLVTLIRVISAFQPPPIPPTDTFVRGIRVHIASPDSGGYAGLDRSIKVHVLRTKGLAPEIDTVIVSLQADSSLGMSPNPIHPALIDTLLLPNGIGVAVDTFKFDFPLFVGYPEMTGIMAQAFLHAPGFAPESLRKLNNLMKQPMSDVEGFTDPVGDGKRIGIDVQRPLTSSIVNVQIDTAYATKRLPGTPYWAYGIGDQIHFNLQVENLGFEVSSADIFLVDAATPGYQHPDSALVRLSYSLVTLIASSGIVRDSLVIAPGMFQTPLAQNNMRVKARAFLVDRAGNFSGDSASNPVASSVDQDFVVVIDSKFPEIFVENLDYITGDIDARFPFVENDGILVPDKFFALNPLRFRVDEGTVSRFVIVGNDTANYGGAVETHTMSFVTADSFTGSIGPINPAGNTVNMRIVVADSVGNQAQTFLENIILDQVPPIISKVFPSSAGIPEKKINDSTRHPRLEVNEPVDTVEVRFIQIDASPPHVSTWTTWPLGPQSLSQTPGIFQITMLDSLRHLESYSLQIRVRDMAGNLNMTLPDTLTFDKNFQSPIADSFWIAPPPESTVLVGSPIPIRIAAIDSKLTRMAGEVRKAVTYNKNGVLVRIIAEGFQDLSGVLFIGDGITNRGYGTANLDASNWWFGERTIHIQSTSPLRKFSVVVEDTSTIIIDGNPAKIINFNGRLSGLTIYAPISETTPAKGLTGMVEVKPGEEILIYSIGCIGDGQATFNGIDLFLSDLQAGTGLSRSDFTELRLYQSTNAELDEGDILIGTVAQADIQIDSITSVSAETPHVTSHTTETFYLVSAVVSPDAVIGRNFRVVAPPGNVETSAGRIGSAVFPPPGDASIATIVGLTISGFVHYYDDTNLSLTSVQVTRFPPGETVKTNVDGKYIFPNVALDSYQISFSRPFDFLNPTARQAIRGSDALMILQKTAFLLPEEPTADQIFAGDINADGVLTNADAVGILRYLAFFDTHIGQTGQWRFQPNQITVNAGESVPDVQAFLMGDVLPNYGRPKDPVLSKPVTLAGILEAVDVDWQEDRVIIPIRVNWGDPVGTLMLSLEYDPDYLQFESVNLTDAGMGYLLVGNGALPGRVHIALAGLVEQLIDAPILQLILKPRNRSAILPDESANMDLSISRLVINDVTVSVEALSALVVQKTPDHFELLQNHPNPFNPDTQIRFALPEDAHVRMVVYNSSGQEVRVLIDRQMGVGFHTVVWDGKDASGRSVSSGVYIYTLNTSADYSVARKMVLLK